MEKRLYFFLGVVSIIAYFFIGRKFLFKNLYYSLEDLTAKLDISKSNAIILTISLSIFPIMVIIAVTLRKYAMLVDRKWGISDLYYSLSYKALKNIYTEKIITIKLLKNAFYLI